MNAVANLPLSWQFRFLAVYNHNDDNYTPLQMSFCWITPHYFFQSLFCKHLKPEVSSVMSQNWLFCWVLEKKNGSLNA